MAVTAQGGRTAGARGPLEPARAAWAPLGTQAPAARERMLLATPPASGVEVGLGMVRETLEGLERERAARALEAVWLVL